MQAADFTSSSFIVRDPVIGNSSGYSASSAFQLFSSGELLFTGTNDSASFTGRFGFLYFPFVTDVTLAGVAGDGLVNLSWNAATSGLGFSVSGYEVGVGTTSGSYSFTNVGNVTSSLQNALTNNTAYYFVVRTLDAFGNAIATSNEISLTPSGATPPASGGGGGGAAIVSGVQFSGYAYPNAKVVVLKNSVPYGETLADAAAAFSIAIPESYDQTAIYTLFAEDTDGIRSLLINYPLVIHNGHVTRITGIIFPPSIFTDKIEIRKPGEVIINGSAIPNRELVLGIGGPAVQSVGVQSSADGKYQYVLETVSYPNGKYGIQVRYQDDPRQSILMELIMGNRTVERRIPGQISGDYNGDKRVDIKDFSIAAYWYLKPNPPESVDVNKDGIVNLVDFSILAFYWTG